MKLNSITKFQPESIRAQVVREMENRIFSGELAMPEDLADANLFLASDQSRYVNGEELKCDGGWTCF